MSEPDIFEAFWYVFERDEEALWALDLPVGRMPISRLEWHLDVPLWDLDGRSHVLTPRDVLKAPYRHADHYQRAVAVSLVFPIEITSYRSRWLILDGVHRLLKAHEQGEETMLVRKVPRGLLKPAAQVPNIPG